MSQVLKALNQSEVGHKKNVPLTAEISSIGVVTPQSSFFSPKALLALLLPSVVCLGYLFYQSYQSRLQEVEKIQQSEPELLTVNAPYKELEYPNFTKLEATYLASGTIDDDRFDVDSGTDYVTEDPFVPRVAVKSDNGSNSKIINSSSNKIVASSNKKSSSDFDLSNLDLSQLSPDLVQRVELVMQEVEPNRSAVAKNQNASSKQGKPVRSGSTMITSESVRADAATALIASNAKHAEAKKDSLGEIGTPVRSGSTMITSESIRADNNAAVTAPVQVVKPTETPVAVVNAPKANPPSEKGKIIRSGSTIISNEPSQTNNAVAVEATTESSSSVGSKLSDLVAKIAMGATTTESESNTAETTATASTVTDVNNIDKAAVDEATLISSLINAAVASEPFIELDPNDPSQRVALRDNVNEFTGRLPALDFQTHVHSDYADKRWVMVNGKDVYEGNAIMEGVYLVKVTSYSSIIRFRNQLIEIPALYTWKG